MRANKKKEEEEEEKEEESGEYFGILDELVERNDEEGEEYDVNLSSVTPKRSQEKRQHRHEECQTRVRGKILISKELMNYHLI